MLVGVCWVAAAVSMVTQHILGEPVWPHVYYQYTVHQAEHSWNEARQICHAGGATLLTVHNQAHWSMWLHLLHPQFHTEKRDKDRFWFGLHAPNTSDPDYLLWDTCEEPEFSAPVVQENHAGDHGCVIMWLNREVFTGVFEDWWVKRHRCDLRLPFVCSRQLKDDDCLPEACDEAVIMDTQNECTLAKCDVITNAINCSVDYIPETGACHVTASVYQSSDVLNVCFLGDTGSPPSLCTTTADPWDYSKVDERDFPGDECLTRTTSSTSSSAPSTSSSAPSTSSSAPSTASAPSTPTQGITPQSSSPVPLASTSSSTSLPATSASSTVLLLTSTSTVSTSTSPPTTTTPTPTPHDQQTTSTLPVPGHTTSKDDIDSSVKDNSTMVPNPGCSVQETTPVSVATTPQQCPCDCTKLWAFLNQSKPEVSSNLTSEEKLEIMVREMTIDKRNTTIARRRFISATDDRASAVSIGAMGGIIIIVVVGTIVAIDLSRLLHEAKVVFRKVFMAMKSSKVSASCTHGGAGMDKADVTSRPETRTTCFDESADQTHA